MLLYFDSMAILMFHYCSHGCAAQPLIRRPWASVRREQFHQYCFVSGTRRLTLRGDKRLNRDTVMHLCIPSETSSITYTPALARAGIFYSGRRWKQANTKLRLTKQTRANASMPERMPPTCSRELWHKRFLRTHSYEHDVISFELHWARFR